MDMSVPKLIVFDLDGTLAESKQPLTDEMAVLLAKLLARTKVAIVSGGALSQFLKQVVARLPVDAPLQNLFLLPTSGAALYEFRNDDWRKVYEERLSESDKDAIEAAIEAAIDETGSINRKSRAWGERIEYRGSQVTFSALGQEAPITEKKVWDPDRTKREELYAAIAKRLPKFAVGIGGSTSIDVTKRGVDKAYGLRKLCERLHLKERDALYVGDELRKDGNDEAVFKTEAETRAVSSPKDTAGIIEAYLGITERAARGG